MSSVSRYSALVAALAILICAGIYFFLERSDSENVFTEPDLKTHTIILTEGGFSPAEITIRKGDEVMFRTERDMPFWPASNLHPTHSLYAAFDPKQPVSPEESWSFIFDIPGNWKFHDHLDPQKTGMITVLSETGEAVQVSSACGEMNGSEKLRCFDQKLESLLRGKGIEAAFTYFKEIYAEDPEVPLYCHSWAHRLGEVEYGFYKEGKEVSLRPEATFCSYGYFHGFINAMVEDTQSLESAQQFCDKAVQEDKEELKGMQSHCVHGIGHSIATLMFESQETWGDVGSVISRSAVECEKLYTVFRTACYDGVFHELYSVMERKDYGMSTAGYEESKDVFYYCRELTGPLAESCYYAFIPLWPYFLEDDKVRAMEYMLDEIPEILLSTPRVLLTFARGFIEMEIGSHSFKDSVEACDATPSDLFEACLHGLATGFVTHGEPGRMHEAGFAFCAEYYQGERRAQCLEFMVEELAWNYSALKLAEACGELSKEDQPEGCKR